MRWNDGVGWDGITRATIFGGVDCLRYHPNSKVCAFVFVCARVGVCGCLCVASSILRMVVVHPLLFVYYVVLVHGSTNLYQYCNTRY